MKLTEKTSTKITNFISEHCNLSVEELQKVKYGIDILILNSYKLVIVFFLAYLLGILTQIFLFMLSYGFIRAFAFGMHARKGSTCLIATCLIFLGLTYYSPLILLDNLYISVLFIINIISLMLFAPADTEKRPIINPKKRKILRIKAISALTLLYLIAIFYCDSLTATILTLSTTVACIMINPILYKIAGQTYDNYKSYKKKEAL
ncbi:MAG: hypothetical protein A2Y24_07320 [Clostridiales bacterium GWE2_32_10]|nr:MAG: hypothetical protein A2Y24_07320 [Clostridiales bacterium GWE2_32_10]HBY21099.1 hypothetical protein [Clostridiales bacterium]